MVHGPSGSVASNDRVRGFQSQIEGPHELFCIPTPAKIDGSFVEWVRESKITGLACWSDDVAFPCMAKLTQAGFLLPRDLSIVGFDSSEACDRSVPPLTSVRQPIVEMGHAAARKLLQMTRSTGTEAEPIPDHPGRSRRAPTTLR